MATHPENELEYLEYLEPDVEKFRAWQQMQQSKSLPQFSHWVLLGSLALFVSTYAIPGSSKPQSGLVGILILVGVLFLHEIGHFLAMKWFGYQNTSIFFLPFFGAAVTGTKHDATLAQNIWMLLAGPLPGILLGIGMAIAISNNPGAAPDWVSETSIMLIVINLLNLLPVYPLDGGKIANLLLCRYPYAEVWLKVVSVMILAGFGLQNFPLLLIALLVSMTIANSLRTAKLHRELQKYVQRSPNAKNHLVHASFKVFYELNANIANLKITSFDQLYGMIKDVVQRCQNTAGQSTRILLSGVYAVSLIGGVVGSYQAFQLPGWKQLRESVRHDREFWKTLRAENQKKIEAANQTLRLNPNDISALYARAAALAASYTPEDTYAAIRDYDQILRIQPNYALAYTERGNARSHLKDYTGAIRDYEQGLRLYPDDVLMYQQRGHARSKIGDFRGAIEDYAQVTRLALTPLAFDNYRSTALAEGSYKPLEDRLQAVDQTIQSNSQNADLYWQRGELRYLLGDDQGGLQDYDQALRLNSNNAQGYLKRATIRIVQRDLKGAIADYDQALRLDPQNIQAYVSRIAARSSWQNRSDANSQKSIKDCEKVLSLQPEAIGMYFKLAQLRSQPDAKIAAYNQVLRSYPTDVKALRGRADVYYDSGRYHRAIQDYDQVLKLDPRNQQSAELLGHWEQRGLARQQLGDYKGAIEDYTEALRLSSQDNPNKAFIYSSRGKARFQAQDYPNALNDYNQALQLAPQVAGYHLERAKVRDRLKDNAGTIADASEAIRLKPFNQTEIIEAYTLRSKARQRIGDKAGAIADQQSAKTSTMQP